MTLWTRPVHIPKQEILWIRDEPLQPGKGVTNFNIGGKRWSDRSGRREQSGQLKGQVQGMTQIAGGKHICVQTLTARISKRSRRCSTGDECQSYVPFPCLRSTRSTYRFQVMKDS